MDERPDTRNTDHPKRRPVTETDEQILAAILQDAREHIAKRRGLPRQPRGVCLTCLLSTPSEAPLLPVAPPSLAARVVPLIKRMVGIPFKRP